MNKKQYKEIADQMVPHIEEVLKILSAYGIESARLYTTSSDGYFSICLSQKDNDDDVEICRLGSDKEVRLKVSEVL